MGQLEFEYFYGNESRQYDFYMIPKVLFTDETFSELSISAKVIYAILLNRSALSSQNGYKDEHNRVYVIFRVSEIEKLLNLSHQSACNHLKALVDIGLINKEKFGMGKADRIYVKNFMSVIIKSKKFRFKECKFHLPQKSIFHTSRSLKIRLLDIKKLDFKKSDFHTSESMKTGLPLYSKKNHKKESDYNDQSIRRPADDFENISKILANNLEIDKMRDSLNPDDFTDYNSVYRFILEYFKNQNPETKIGKNNLKTENVKKALLGLTPDKIRTVVSSISKADTSKVTNYSSYLLSCLYKAALQSSEQEQIHAGIASLFNKNKKQDKSKFDDFNNDWLNDWSKNNQNNSL